MALIFWAKKSDNVANSFLAVSGILFVGIIVSGSVAMSTQYYFDQIPEQTDSAKQEAIDGAYSNLRWAGITSIILIGVSVIGFFVKGLQSLTYKKQKQEEIEMKEEKEKEEKEKKKKEEEEKDN